MRGLKVFQSRALLSVGDINLPSSERLVSPKRLEVALPPGRVLYQVQPLPIIFHDEGQQRLDEQDLAGFRVNSGLGSENGVHH